MDFTLAPARGARTRVDSDSEIDLEGERRDTGYSSVGAAFTPSGRGCKDAGQTPVMDGRTPVPDGSTPGIRALLTGVGRGRPRMSEPSPIGGERSSVRVESDASPMGNDRHVTFRRHSRDGLLMEMAAEIAEIRRSLCGSAMTSSDRPGPVVPIMPAEPVALAALAVGGASPHATAGPVCTGRTGFVPVCAGRTGFGPVEPTAARQADDPRPTEPIEDQRPPYDNNRMRTTLPTLKLVQFDGTKPLETFVAKFNNCSDYYRWGERERLCHLRAGLDGEAAHVLCDLDQAATSEDLIAMLRRRFGNQDQRERFRAELKAIVRRDGASLQSIYSEVRRIMALAFPGERGGLWEILARDTFLSALRDEPLRQRVMERDPQTLDDTLRIACHLEAIVRPAAEPSFDDLGRRRVKATHDREPEDAERRATERRLQHLETAVDQYRAELDRCRAENDELRRPPPPPTGPVYPPPSYRPDMATFFAHEPVPASPSNYGPTGAVVAVSGAAADDRLRNTDEIRRRPTEGTRRCLLRMRPAGSPRPSLSRTIQVVWNIERRTG